MLRLAAPLHGRSLAHFKAVTLQAFLFPGEFLPPLDSLGLGLGHCHSCDSHFQHYFFVFPINYTYTFTYILFEDKPTLKQLTLSGASVSYWDLFRYSGSTKRTLDSENGDQN